MNWYQFLTGVVVGAVVPPILIWALFRYDRHQMRHEVRRELRRAK